MNKSDEIKNLAIALSKFNGDVEKIEKDANNPFFKNTYATLDTIVAEVRPILCKYGLSILQIPGGDGSNVIMKTLLVHESGEWIESDELIMKPVKNDPQAVGSCITYARRYSLASFLSLNMGQDDDGNAATHGHNDASKHSNNTGSKNNGGSNKPLSEAQTKRLYAIANKNGIDEQGVNRLLLKKYHVTTTSELSKQQYDEVVSHIETNYQSIIDWLSKKQS